MKAQLELDQNEQIALQALEQSAGYKVLRKMAEFELASLRALTDQTDPAETQKVLAAQAVSHAAGKFWDGLTADIAAVVVQAAKGPEKPLSDADKKLLQDADILEAGRVRTVTV